MKRLRGLPPIVAAPASRFGAPRAGSGFARQDGLTTTQRGYGADWRKARAAHLAVEPCCRFCRASGRTVAATDVDHIIPFQGRDDPRRLDRHNLRSLCGPCHAARSARQAAGRGIGGV